MFSLLFDKISQFPVFPLTGNVFGYFHCFPCAVGTLTNAHLKPRLSIRQLASVPWLPDNEVSYLGFILKIFNVQSVGGFIANICWHVLSFMQLTLICLNLRKTVHMIEVIH